MEHRHDQDRERGWLLVGTLYRSAVIGFAFMILSAVPVLFFTDEVYAIHNSFMSMERNAYNLMMFRLLGEMKILVLIFFLVPAMGLHWTLAQSRSQQTPSP